jgi:hypothetical protein
MVQLGMIYIKNYLIKNNNKKMATVKNKVSVEIDWTNNTANIVTYDPLKSVGCHRINDDGTEELDVWVMSEVFENRMKSKVVEFIKTPRGGWTRVTGNQVSNRYNGLEMVLSDSVYLNTTNGLLAKNESDIYEDDLTKEILDTTNSELPVSFEPKKYEKKVKANLVPAFSFFQQSVKFKDSMFADMTTR